MGRRPENKVQRKGKKQITEHKHADESMQWPEQFVSTLSRISKIFLAGGSDEEMYDEVLRLVLEVMESPYGVFGYINEEGDLVCPSMTRHIWSRCQMSHKTIIFPENTWGDSIWGQGLRTGKPRYLNTRFTVPEGHLPVDRCLTVPLLYQGRSIGLLTVANKPQDFTDDDLNVLQRIGEYVAPVLNARLEQQRSNRALIESKTEFSVLAEQSITGITVIQEGKWVYVNPRMAEMFGYTQSDMVGMKPIEVVAEADREKVLESFRKRLSGEIPYAHYTFRGRRRDGSEIEVEVYGNTLSYHGSPAILSTLLDITEHRKAEAALLESELRFRCIFDGTMDGIILANATDQKFILGNKTICTMLGYTQDELLTMRPEDLHPADALPRVMKHFADLKKGVPSVAQEIPVKRKDGSVFYADIGGSMMEIGGRIYFIGVFRDVTERKRASEQQQLLASIIEASDDLIGIADPEGRLLYLNSAGQKLVGLDNLEDVLNKSVRQFHMEADYHRFKTEIMPSIMQAGSWTGETAYRHFKTGAPVYVEMNGFVIRDAMTGRPIGSANISRNITERKRREERLKKINTSLLSLNEIDHAANLHALTTLCGEILDADCALYNRLEGDLLCVRGQWAAPADLKKEDAPQGHICFDVISRDSDHPLVIRNLQDTNYAKTDPNVAAYGLRTYVGCRVRYGGNARGSLCTVYTRDYAPSSDDLDVMSIIASAIATEEERFAVEKKLRHSEEFARNILDTVDEGFIVIDRDYRIVTVNRAYCDLMSVSCNEVTGKHCYEISHRTHKPCHEAGEECAVRTVFETGRPHTTVHNHIDENGRVIHVETKAFPLQDASGNIISVIETINNITEQLLFEEERLKTQKLEAIGTLAGGIAHDFNNLLQGVFGYISLAKLTADKREKSIAALEQAEKALHQAVSLTTQLLTFSKGGAPLKKVLALRPVIENAAKFALSGSRSYFQLGADDDLWPTEADEGQIGRVIQNIVLNADQAMPEGGKVEITARNVQVPGTDLPPGLRNGRYVEIAIRDSGIGIPEQYLTKIFDPYFTSKDRGSGLGLATSYSIIKNHGGRIEVKSSPGEGSTFLIYLPVVAVQKEEIMSVAEVVPSRSGKVLIMDDEPVVLNVVGELVRALGHEVEFAEHGTVAIEKYSQARASGKPYDVVILDLTIRGGMGGAETVRKLLEIDPEVKAVVSSGYSDADVVSKYREYGFSAFLKKPYKVDDLQDVLTMLIR